MEKLKLRLESLNNALKTLEKTVTKIEANKYTDYEEIRDSLIQRFEYCADTFWKVLKDYLRVKFNTDNIVAKPKEIYKECANLKIINIQEHEILINLIEDRNQTSHAYNEEFAEEVAKKIPIYFYTMKEISLRLNI